MNTNSMTTIIETPFYRADLHKNRVVVVLNPVATDASSSRLPQLNSIDEDSVTVNHLELADDNAIKYWRTHLAEMVVKVVVKPEVEAQGRQRKHILSQERLAR